MSECELKVQELKQVGKKEIVITNYDKSSFASYLLKNFENKKHASRPLIKINLAKPLHRN
jgi:hypothetical protein